MNRLILTDVPLDLDMENTFLNKYIENKYPDDYNFFWSLPDWINALEKNHPNAIFNFLDYICQFTSRKKNWFTYDQKVFMAKSILDAIRDGNIDTIVIAKSDLYLDNFRQTQLTNNLYNAVFGALDRFHIEAIFLAQKQSTKTVHASVFVDFKTFNCRNHEKIKKILHNHHILPNTSDIYPTPWPEIAALHYKTKTKKKIVISSDVFILWYKNQSINNALKNNNVIFTQIT